MPQQLDPRIRRFQELKRQEKIARIAVRSIREANPELTEKQARQIFEAQQKAQKVNSQKH